SATITGTATINGGALDLQGNRLTNGLLVVNGSGVVTNAVTGATLNGSVSNANVMAVTQDTFLNGPIVNTGVMGFQGAISNALVNSGSFNLNNNATITVAPVNTGTFNVGANTLTVNPAWSNDGSVQITGGFVVGGTITNDMGGTI